MDDMLQMRKRALFMRWLNEPAKWEAKGTVVHARADPRTDFWRKTHDGGTRDNGHFYYQPVTGNFTAQVKLRGEYRDPYDQAGLMARVDETTWLKCGVELVDGRPLASVVVTRDFSDWSVVPISETSVVWWRLTRDGGTFEVCYALDGTQFQRFRQSFLSESPQVDVGLMICSPVGEGFAATFEDLQVG